MVDEDDRGVVGNMSDRPSYALIHGFHAHVLIVLLARQLADCDWLPVVTRKGGCSGEGGNVSNFLLQLWVGGVGEGKSCHYHAPSKAVREVDALTQLASDYAQQQGTRSPWLPLFRIIPCGGTIELDSVCHNMCTHTHTHTQYTFGGEIELDVCGVFVQDCVCVTGVARLTEDLFLLLYLFDVTLALPEIM